MYYIHRYVCVYIYIYIYIYIEREREREYTRRWTKAVGKPEELGLGLELGALFLWRCGSRHTRTRGIGLREGAISAEVIGFV